MRAKILLLLPLVYLTTACSTAVPVHEAEVPEVINSRELRATQYSTKSPTMGTDLGTNNNDKNYDPLVGYRLGVGLPKNFQANIDIFASGFGGSGSGASVKYQWMGDTYFKAKAGNFSQTTVARTFRAESSGVSVDSPGVTFDYADSKIWGLDIAHILGYRFTNWFGVYAGPKLTAGKVKTHFRDDEEGPVVATKGRKFDGKGVVAGTYIAIAGDRAGFDVVVEYNGYELPATFGSKDTWYEGYAIAISVPFGI